MHCDYIKNLRQEDLNQFFNSVFAENVTIADSYKNYDLNSYIFKLQSTNDENSIAFAVLTNFECKIYDVNDFCAVSKVIPLCNDNKSLDFLSNEEVDDLFLEFMLNQYPIISEYDPVMNSCGYADDYLKFYQCKIQEEEKRFKREIVKNQTVVSSKNLVVKKIMKNLNKQNNQKYTNKMQQVCYLTGKISKELGLTF